MRNAFFGGPSMHPPEPKNCLKAQIDGMPKKTMVAAFVF